MFKRLRSYYRIKKSADKLLDDIEKFQKEQNMNAAKSIFKSKTFWVNLFALLNELIKILPLSPSVQGITIPTEVMAVGLPVVNVLLRRITNTPVKVITDDMGKGFKKEV